MWGWISGQSEPGKEGEGAKPEDNLEVIPGLPSPVEDVDFQMAAAEMLEKVKKYAAEENTPEAGWQPVSHSTEDVVLFERKIPELETLTLMKAIGTVENCSPADILGFTLEHDLNKRKEFDPDISLLEVVKEINPTLQVTRTHFVAPYPIYPREFVDMRSWVEGDDKIIFGATSINMKDGPRSSEHVRGASWNGIIMEKVPGKAEGTSATKLIFMGYVDPSGWVPHSVIAMFRGKITERIDVFRKMVARAKESGK